MVRFPHLFVVLIVCICLIIRSESFMSNGRVSTSTFLRMSSSGGLFNSIRRVVSASM